MVLPVLIKDSPCCRVSPPRKSVQVVRDRTPEPVVRRVVIRAKTPEPDVIERVIIKRQPQHIIEKITQQPRIPPPRIVHKIVYEPCPCYANAQKAYYAPKTFIPRPVVAKATPAPVPVPPPRIPTICDICPASEGWKIVDVPQPVVSPRLQEHHVLKRIPIAPVQTDRCLNDICPASEGWKVVDVSHELPKQPLRGFIPAKPKTPISPRCLRSASTFIPVPVKTPSRCPCQQSPSFHHSSIPSAPVQASPLPQSHPPPHPPPPQPPHPSPPRQQSLLNSQKIIMHPRSPTVSSLSLSSSSTSRWSLTSPRNSPRPTPLPNMQSFFPHPPPIQPIYHHANYHQLSSLIPIPQNMKYSASSNSLSSSTYTTSTPLPRPTFSTVQRYNQTAAKYWDIE